MFDFTDDNEVLYKAGEIPKLNEIQKIESIINDLASNDVLRKPDAGASEKQLEEIKSGNIGILNMIDKEINIKEISDLINVLRMYINRQNTFTGGSQVLITINQITDHNHNYIMAEEIKTNDLQDMFPGLIQTGFTQTEDGQLQYNVDIVDEAFNTGKSPIEIISYCAQLTIRLSILNTISTSMHLTLILRLILNR